MNTINAEVSGKKSIASTIFKKYSAVIILIALIVISSILSPVFLTVGNVFNVLRQQVPYMMVALGILMTILTGGIDLSSGTVLSVSHVFLALGASAWGLNTSGGIWAAILLCVLVGFAFGSLNGVLVAKLKLAPFIATLATMTIAKGLSFQMTGGSPVRLPTNEPGSEALFNFGQGGDPLFGMPLSVWVAIVIIVVFWYIMKYTMFGRMIIASGSNKDAVRLAGVNVDKYIFSAYAISGAMAGIAGIMIAARAGVAVSSNGTGYELDAIAACVIGGASLSGGKGGVINTIVGVMIIALIGNIMNLLSVPAYPQQMIQGVIIIAAVVMNSVTSKDEK